jgi:hypothetical protein
MSFALKSLGLVSLGKLLLLTPWGRIASAAVALAVFAEKAFDISGTVKSWFEDPKVEPLRFGDPIGREHGLAADQPGHRPYPAFMGTPQQFNHLLRVDLSTGSKELISDPAMPSNTGLILEND